MRGAQLRLVEFWNIFPFGRTDVAVGGIRARCKMRMGILSVDATPFPIRDCFLFLTGLRTSADVSNLNSGLGVLDLLGNHVDGLPLRDIAKALDRSRSTTHRLLNTLAGLGYVSQEGELSPYRLTMKLPLSSDIRN